MPQIVKGRPPNIQAIAEVFPLAWQNNVVFAYGDTIYRPSGAPISPEVMAHELVHCERQLAHPGGVRGWWSDYLTDKAFLYNEELLAHRAEYKHLTETAPSRQARRSALKQIAKKLSAALYGNMVTFEQAKEALVE